MPGMHQARVGTHRIVWWDPARLELDVRETMGLRQIRLLEQDDKKERSTRGIAQWNAWNDQRAKLLASGAAASIRVNTATELSTAEIKQLFALRREAVS